MNYDDLLREPNATPGIRVKAWRAPNEDGADRVMWRDGTTGKLGCMVFVQKFPAYGAAS